MPAHSVTHSESETAAMGVSFSSRLRPGDVVAVTGALGAGKTRFIQGICRGLGVKEHVASPTFTIISEYSTPSLDVYHFDLYRLNSPGEISDLGFEEYVTGEGVCLIEWAEKAAALLPSRRYDVTLEFGEGRDDREITIEDKATVAA